MGMGPPSWRGAATPGLGCLTDKAAAHREDDHAGNTMAASVLVLGIAIKVRQRNVSSLTVHALGFDCTGEGW